MTEPPIIEFKRDATLPFVTVALFLVAIVSGIVFAQSPEERAPLAATVTAGAAAGGPAR